MSNVSNTVKQIMKITEAKDLQELGKALVARHNEIKKANEGSGDTKPSKKGMKWFGVSLSPQGTPQQEFDTQDEADAWAKKKARNLGWKMYVVTRSGLSWKAVK